MKYKIHDGKLYISCNVDGALCISTQEQAESIVHMITSYIREHNTDGDNAV